jgi:hypothetical protein
MRGRLLLGSVMTTVQKGVATAASAGHPPAAATASSHGLEGCGDLLSSV